ncbi:MAG TPA: hypothetical protein VG759_16700 [Candidatus Angelobacter sp.]|nr:hypothetical protein [Candidatus Angelobacter sp.]
MSKAGRIAKGNSTFLPTGVFQDDVDRQLAKILESKPFAGAIRSKYFLQYTVSKLLEGQINQIKEYTIGVEVFGKDESFDPRCSPIVRVEAARLRKKLQAYVNHYGMGDVLIIDLPKGTYVPVVRKAHRPQTSQADVEALFAGKMTIRVLPFLILENDKDTEVFGKQLAEELMQQLASITALSVCALADWFRSDHVLDGAHPVDAPPQADLLLQAGIHRTDPGLQIKVFLTDLSGEMPQPYIAFEGIVQLLSASRREIVTHVVSAVKTILSNRRPDAHAYRREDSSLNLKDSISYQETSGNRNPNALLPSAENQSHARNLARLAHFYVSQVLQGVAAPHTVMPKAELAVRESLNYESCLPLAHLALGLIHFYYLWNASTAQWHFSRASQLAPNDVDVMTWCAHKCLVLSGPRKAIRQIEQILAYQQESNSARLNLSLAWYLLRDYDQALYYAEKAVHANPQCFWGHWILGASQGECFQDEKAIKHLETAIGISANSPPLVAWLAHFYASRAMNGKARALVSELIHLSNQKYVSPAALALGHLALGEKDRSIQLLEQAWVAKDSFLVYVKILPCFSSLHSDDRFESLVNRMGLGISSDFLEPAEPLVREQISGIETDLELSTLLTDASLIS